VNAYLDVETLRAVLWREWFAQAWADITGAYADWAS